MEIELKYLIYNKIKKINYFSVKNKKFIGIIGEKLKIQNYNNNEYIFEKNQFAEEIFFIYEGVIKVIGNNDKILYYIEQGNYFGEWDIFYNNSIRKFSVKSDSKLILFILKKEEFFRIYYHLFIKYKQEMVGNSYIRYNKLIDINEKVLEEKSNNKKIASRYSKNKNIKFYKRAKKTLANIKKSNSDKNKKKILEKIDNFNKKIIKIDHVLKRSLNFQNKFFNK